MKTIKTAYLVAMPDVGDDPHVFTFSANTPSGAFTFSYRWDYLSNVWLLFIALPDGSVRQAGVYPNDMSWTGWLDFGFYMQTELINIGQNDLTKISQYIVVWDI